MGLQKYRFDQTGKAEPNGSVPLYTQWNGGQSLAGIRHCPCQDGKTRTVYVTGEADTVYSIPAVASVGGSRTVGWISHDESGYFFQMPSLGWEVNPDEKPESNDVRGTYGVRRDCTRDNRITILPNAWKPGGGTVKAQRGSIVCFERDNATGGGRVIGRVHCEGKTYLEIARWDNMLMHAYVSWIDPACVRECCDKPHTKLLAFLLGDDWHDAETIHRTLHNGFVRES
jgi:hypothetical protein